MGRAANRYVDLQNRPFTFSIVAGIVFLILFVIFLFAVIIPGFSSGPGGLAKQDCPAGVYGDICK